jgi:ribonucleoside-diphosphate reductase alpha chain
MKITKIRRAVENCPTYDVTTRSGAYALPNGCVSHNSSVVLNSTNGINFVKQLIVVKESKAGAFVQVAPEYRKLKNHYQLLWDQPDCIDYLKTVAVLQVYVDQGISADTFYNSKFFRSTDAEQDGKVPATLIAKNLMLAHKWGLKSHYYDLRSKQDTRSMTKEIEEVVAAEEDGEDFCESCVL